MSMYQGLDLSRFKKISSDAKTSTLRHSKGHEIKIAHSGLSPKMREHLDSLPVYMAGGTDGTAPVPVDNDSPEEAEAAPETPDVPEAPVAEAPAPEAPPVAAAPTPVPAAPAQPAAAPQPSDANTIDVIGVKPPPPTPGQEMKIDSDAFKQDLDLGRIKPETYQSLYGKQDTLGKIGTLFGLLVSGAGSGLSHQPNAVLNMMDKQISNDLEAQKASNSNAQNLYQLTLKHEMQKADIKNQQIQQQIALSKNPAEIKALEAQANNNNTNARIAADGNARIRSNWIALDHLAQNINKIPPTLANGAPNPMYVQAQQKLMFMTQGIQNENYSISSRAEASMALAQAVSGKTQGGGGEEDFQKGQTALRVGGQAPLADDRAARHLPGVKGQASIPLTSQDREEILSGTQFQDQLQRFMDWTKKHSGDLSPKDRAEGQSLAVQLNGAYRMATKGGTYSPSEEGFISKVIDETPTKFFNEIRVLPKLQAVQRESRAQLDERMKSKGLPGYEGPSVAQKGGQSGGGETRPGKDGKQYRKVAGGWIPVDSTAVGLK